MSYLSGIKVVEKALMENLWELLSWLHKIIMNHKIGIILRLVTTNHISIIGISVVT